MGGGQELGDGIRKHDPVFLGWQGGRNEDRKNPFKCWRRAGITLSGRECRVPWGSMGQPDSPPAAWALNPNQHSLAVLPFFYRFQLSQCRQGVGWKLDRSGAGILARKHVKGRKKPGGLMRGPGNVYSDDPRTLNVVERNKDIRGRGTTDRCWDSWTTGSSGISEFLDLVGERKKVGRRAEVKSSSQSGGPWRESVEGLGLSTAN